MVVLIAEVAQPCMFQLACGILGQCLSTICIAQVSAWSENTSFQMLRVWSVLKHFLVVVCLYDKILCLCDYGLHLVRDAAYICHKAEAYSMGNNLVTHVVRTVMGYLERSYLEVSQQESLSFLYDFLQVLGNLVLYAPVAVYSLMHLLRSIYWELEVPAQASY